MLKRIFPLIVFFTGTITAHAQFRTRAQQLMTNEDSLSRGVNASKTVISGYGSAFYQRDFDARVSTMTLERAVLFVGHQFN
ncbi:MAG TPA: hypothetical protein VKT28_03420, partial [Puia sp.]|nr:hypothetical protein [Puia sp.]